MMEWIISNKEWVFSGIGVFVLSLIMAFITWLYSRNKQQNKNHITMKQKGGKNSENYQSKGDINILISRNDDK